MVTAKEGERTKTRREKIGGYFLNLSQLTFAAVVLGGFPGLFNYGDSMLVAAIKILLGVLFTIGLAWIGNNILK